MKSIVCICFLGLVVAALARPDDGKYTTKYDGANLDEILQSKRLLNTYFDCIMDKGPCTSDGKELKSIMPDALETDCAKCNEKQKEGAKKVIKYLMKHHPEMWEKLTAKYDPQGVYAKNHEAELKEVQENPEH